MNGATNEEVARFDSILRETQRVSLGSQALGSLLNLGQVLIFSSGLLASLKLALRSHFKDPSFSVGDVVAVNALLLQLAQPMNYLGYTVSEIRQGLVDVDAVVQASKAASAEAASNVDDLTVEKPPAISFESVSARRDGEIQLLIMLPSRRPAGQVTVLCGASGSGKSTALRLLSGLDSVTEGLVKMVRARGRRGPMTRCTVVAQDGTLFDETVAFNVRVGSSASDSEVAAALARVGSGFVSGGPRRRARRAAVRRRAAARPGSPSAGATTSPRPAPRRGDLRARRRHGAARPRRAARAEGRDAAHDFNRGASIKSRRAGGGPRRRF